MSSDLLTVECLEELKVNLPNGPQFLGCGSFNTWIGVGRHSSEEIYNSLFECYNAYYSGQVEEWRTRMSSRLVVRSSSAVDRASAECSQPGSCSSVVSDRKRK